MHLDTFIIDLALIMGASAIVSILFRKLHLPTVLGYITAGFLISPHFTLLPTVVETDNIQTWSTIGIVFLMFGLGLEFSFVKLSRVGSSAIITAMTVMSGMTVVGITLGHMLGFGRMDAVFLGCMLSMSSTMIIMKAFEEYGLKEERSSSLVLGALVVEDVGGIFMIIVLSAISVGSGISGGELVSKLGIMLLMLVVWLALGIYLLPTLLKKTRGLLGEESLLILSLAICFGMVVISHEIGFSEALGAFMGGSILAGTVSGERIEELVKPLKDMFGAVFFVSVGMMIIPAYLIEYLVPIIIIAIVTIVGQMVLSTLGILLSGQSGYTAVKGGSSMVQIGEFSFILAALGRDLNATGEYLLPVIVLVAVITIFLTPVFIKTADRRYAFLFRHLPDRLLKAISKYTSDKRDTSDNSADWKHYMATYTSRTVVIGAILFLLHYVGYSRVMPLFEERFGDTAGSILCCLLTIVLMIPLISLLLGRRSATFKKLWLSSPTNRMPLTLLRTLQMGLSLLFIMLSLVRMLEVNVFWLIPAGLLVLAVAVRSDFLRGQSLKIEARFMANFNEKVLQNRKEARSNEQWLEDRVCVVQFGLSKTGDSTNVRLLLDDRINDVLIIKIVRGGTHINMPGPDEEIFVGDQLYAMASKEQLEGYIKALERAENIKEPDTPMITLREYVYTQAFHGIKPEDQIMVSVIQAEKEMSFCGKSIRNCGFKNDYKGFIVAIDRDNLNIVDPPLDTIIEQHDLVWVVGGLEMAQRLLEDGILENI